MNKRGAEMSMSVIIVAAIALLVLIILAVLILGAGRRVSEGTGCAGTGGTCYSSCADLAEDQGGIWTPDVTNGGTKGGCRADEQCCIKIGGGAEE
ncbi:hypothetical protein JW756_02165 [Candidatus Woesearchaeota archaeon]|nr:hypothetical protein [Candidatus Woesearchaeota archaeon]